MQPHRKRYWLTPPPDDPSELAQQISTVCKIYEAARALAAEGSHVMSTDEMTGIQALERLHPCLPMLPGHVQRLEFEYERHGTLSLIAKLDVVTGQVVTPSLGPTRTEADFAAHIAASHPDRSASQLALYYRSTQYPSVRNLGPPGCPTVRYPGGIRHQGKKRHLTSMKTRAAFLSESSHRIRFVYTPKHRSWLNQMEIWFSLLVRRLLARAS